MATDESVTVRARAFARSWAKAPGETAQRAVFREFLRWAGTLPVHQRKTAAEAFDDKRAEEAPPV
jgi:hypothetical protein